MKLRNGFELKKYDGQYQVVCTDKTVSFNNSIILGETSAFLWKQLSTGEKSKEELLNSLLSNFDISTVLALSDIDAFVKILSRNGIIE